MLEPEAPEVLTIDELLVNKEKYIQAYNLSDSQFELVREFFNEKKDENSLLPNSLIRLLMNEAIKERSDVHASEEDVKRALQSVDEDQDDKITFDQFLILLLLFFSSKSNMAIRVSRILNAKYANSTSLSAQEANQFASFLNNFYGKAQNDNHDDGVQSSQLVESLLSQLESSAFVYLVEESASQAAEEEQVQQSEPEEAQPEQQE